MPRTAGARNRDYEEKRERLLLALDAPLRQAGAERLTLGEMAGLARVSVSSLRHHLGGRTEILAAALTRQGALGAPYLAWVRAPSDLPATESVRQMLQFMQIGLERGLGDLVAGGLSLSLREPEVAPTFLDAILEPILQATEARLAHHAARGELTTDEVRLPALMLVSPLVLAALHQHGLCGATVRPLSLSALVDAQVSAFVLAFVRA